MDMTAYLDSDSQDVADALRKSEREAVISLVRDEGCSIMGVIANAHWFANLCLNGVFNAHGYPECSPGCHFCCHLDRIDSIRPEVEYMLEGYEGELVLTGDACPFLQEGQCRVYDRRPLMCRAWHSYDKELCKLAYEKKDGDIAVPVCKYAVVIGTSILSGMIDALRECGEYGVKREDIRVLLKERR